MSKELEGWNIQHVTPIWIFHVHYGGFRSCCRTLYLSSSTPLSASPQESLAQATTSDVEKIPNRFVTPAPLPFFWRIEIAAEPACSLLMQLPCQPLSISASLPDTNWLSPQIDGLVLPLGLGRWGWVDVWVWVLLILQTSLTVLDNLLKRVFPWMLPFLLASSFLIHLTYCLQSQKAAWELLLFFWVQEGEILKPFQFSLLFYHMTLYPLRNCKWCCASPCRTWGYLWMDGLGKEFWLFVLELMDVHLLG